MNNLSGPPRLNGELIPFGQLPGGLDMDWDDESEYKDLEPAPGGGLAERLVGDKLFRGRITLSYESLDPADYAVMFPILAAPTFQFAPRTLGPGDDLTQGVPVFECRVEGRLKAVRPLNKDPKGFRWSVKIITTHLIGETGLLPQEAPGVTDPSNVIPGTPLVITEPSNVVPGVAAPGTTEPSNVVPQVETAGVTEPSNVIPQQ